MIIDYTSIWINCYHINTQQANSRSYTENIRDNPNNFFVKVFENKNVEERFKSLMNEEMFPVPSFNDILWLLERAAGTF